MPNARLRHAPMLALVLSAAALPAGEAVDGAVDPAAVVYELDLRERDDDCFHPRLVLPAAERGEVFFQMPVSVPGTYQRQDWGRLVSELRALDAEGGELAVERVDENRWRIAERGRLAELRWTVEDTFDREGQTERIYPMAGTNIEDDNVVLNHFGVLGYIVGERHRPIEVRYRFPADWQVACAIPTEAVPAQQGGWLLKARDYQHLADSPLLAGDLVIGGAMVDGADLQWAARNPQGGAYSAEYMEAAFAPVIRATHEWLGDLPTDRYAFLLYGRNGMVRMMGALEHRQSSLFYLPSYAPRQSLQHIAAHEFFHIVTPLNIRSERIEDFDFADPQSPAHLWFYEGVTEYASLLIMRHGGLLDDPGLIRALQRKFATSNAFRARYEAPVSLIELSEGAFDQHKALYMDIYMRGALLALLIQALLARYRAGKPFAHERFFAVLGELGHPDLPAFLERHVAGTEPPPFAELLSQAGIVLDMGEPERIEIEDANGRVRQFDKPAMPRISLTDAPSEAQLAFRRAWLD